MSNELSKEYFAQEERRVKMEQNPLGIAPGDLVEVRTDDGRKIIGLAEQSGNSDVLLVRGPGGPWHVTGAYSTHGRTVRVVAKVANSPRQVKGSDTWVWDRPNALTWRGETLEAGTRVLLTHHGGGRQWDRRPARVIWDSGQQVLRVKWDNPTSVDAYPDSKLRRDSWLEMDDGRKLELMPDPIPHTEDKTLEVWEIWEDQFTIQANDIIQVTSPTRNWSGEYATVTGVTAERIKIAFRDKDATQDLSKKAYINHREGRYISVQRIVNQPNSETIDFKKEGSTMEFNINAIKTIDGWHGTIVLDDEIVWQSEPIVVDTSKDADPAGVQAQEVARQHLNDKIVGLLA